MNKEEALDILNRANISSDPIERKKLLLEVIDNYPQVDSDIKRELQKFRNVLLEIKKDIRKEK